MKKYLYILMSAVMMAFSIGCSKDSNEFSVVSVNSNSSTALYAIVKPEGAQLVDTIPSDYVLTLDNIIAVNPETGEFKLKDTERIDSRAYPNYDIQFYSEGILLFEAHLNSAISSDLPKGLTFCHFLSDEKGLARYDLGVTRMTIADGKVIEETLTEKQRVGMQLMYNILQKAGKTSSNIDYDFNFSKKDVNILQISNGDNIVTKNGYVTKSWYMINMMPSTMVTVFHCDFLDSSLKRLTFRVAGTMLDIDLLQVGKIYQRNQFGANVTSSNLRPNDWYDYDIISYKDVRNGCIKLVDKKKVGYKNVLTFEIIDLNLDGVITVNGTVEFEFGGIVY